MKTKKAQRILVKTHKNEVWKKLKSGDSSAKMNYMVSNFGRLKSVNKKSKDEFLVKGNFTKGGYHRFGLKTEENERKSYYIHMEVAKLYLGRKTKDKLFVCHKDGNKKNNRAKNLMWANKEEWSKLHKKLGTFNNPDRNPITYSKLNVTKVKAIKKSLRAGKKTKTSIAQKYGVSITQINRIASGENWGSVTID